MTTCSTADCRIAIGNWSILNNKWGQPSATQSISSSGNTVTLSYQNPGGGYNYVELEIGTDRGNIPSTWSVFPIKVSSINTMKLDIAWNYPQNPTTGSGDGSALALDLYFGTGSPYHNFNFMIWLQTWNFGPSSSDKYVNDVNDGYNIYSHYAGTRVQGSDTVPWHVFILKNQQSGPTSISIDIKKLIDAIPQINTSWSMPDVQIGMENQSGSGSITFTGLNLNVNGQNAGFGSTNTPTSQPTTNQPSQPTQPTTNQPSQPTQPTTNQPSTGGTSTNISTWLNKSTCLTPTLCMPNKVIGIFSAITFVYLITK